MSWKKELEVVKRTSVPITKSSLRKDFKKIGLSKGTIVIVHSSMSKIGWVSGREVAVVEALMETVTEAGTIAMPSMTTGNTNPVNWQNPPVPKEWWSIIQQERPPYRPEISPTRGMGRIAELFRKYPGVVRSSHPVFSFSAWGQHADEIVSEHPIDEPFGHNSPLGKLCKLNAKILLLGVNHQNNTSLHHAEWLAKNPNKPKVNNAAAILENGVRVWKTWIDFDYDDDNFDVIGYEFEKSIGYVPGNIGNAEAHLVDMKAVVDFGVQWLKANRRYEG